MKNASLSYEQNFFVNGTGLSGVQSINGSYGINEQPINIIGHGYVNNIINQPLEGEFTIQRTLINEDALLNMTGDNIAFSGVVTYKHGAVSTGSFGFHSGYLTSYSMSCEVGNLPSVSTNISVYGDLGPGILSASESLGLGTAAAADKTIEPPNAGTITISCDELQTSTNRIVSFSHEVNCPRQAVYALPVSASDTKAKLPVQVDSVYPIEETTNLTLEIDDYQTKNLYDYLTGVFTGKVDIDINGNNGTNLASFHLDDARLISESFSSDVDGVALANLTFINYTNRTR